MSVIVKYAFRSQDLVLTDTLSGLAVRLDVERITALTPDRPQLFLWVTGDDLAAFDEEARHDPTVTDIQVLSEVDDKRLYSLRITDATEVVLYPEWVRLGGQGLRARYEDGWWHSRIRFPDRDAASDYLDRLEELGIEVQLTRVYDTDGTNIPDDNLSDEQRETLKLAYERGHFDIPRNATTGDLAAELDISDQAVSERLRRGHARLVERHLDVEQE